MNGLRRFENLTNQRVTANPPTDEQDQALQPAAAEPLSGRPQRVWPVWADLIARLRNAEDKGVGDTVHRKLAAAGEAFKLTLQALGVPCGCDRRREEWNRLYSYGDHNADQERHS
jgi:hypothetical protein